MPLASRLEPTAGTLPVGLVHGTDSDAIYIFHDKFLERFNDSRFLYSETSLNDFGKCQYFQQFKMKIQ